MVDSTPAKQADRVEVTARRTERLTAIGAIAWAFFVVHDGVLGHGRVVCVNAVVASFIFGLWWLVRVRRELARPVAHGVVLASIVGVCLVTAWSGGASSPVPWYLAAVPLFAAHLFGVLETIAWSLVAALALALSSVSAQVPWLHADYTITGFDLFARKLGLELIVLAFALAARFTHDRQVRAIETHAAALAVARDAALESSRLKTEFLATLSHELRTPLNGVLGMTSVLLDRSLEPDVREMLGTVASSGEQLLALLNDILDLAKIEAGRLAIEPVPTDVRALVDDAQRLFTPAARDKGVVLEVRVAADVPSWVLADRARIRQVVVNLVGNAVKFTEHGRVEVRIERREDALSIVVRDTGIGIPEDHLARIFVPFTQADASIARRFGGTGLGLAISRRLLDRMGGAIDVVSVAGEGSTFTVTLPLHVAAAPDPALDRTSASMEAPESIDRTAGARVLLVEDLPVNRRVARMMLDRLGALTTEAIDGAEAIDKALADDFDVVLMDLQLPGIDGLEATRRIRAMRVDGKQPWIVAMTANVSAADRQACRDAGMDDFVGKPVAAGELAAALVRARRARAAILPAS
ncbi:MAG: ATP-binding protein [Polyangiales bacterium]